MQQKIHSMFNTMNYLGAMTLLAKGGLQLGLVPMVDVFEGLDPQSCQPLAVRVDGISKKTTRESLSKYFGDGHKSGGGHIEKLEYIEEEGFAVITFADADSE